MIKKSGWLKNGIATSQGIVDKKGKLLKSRKMTQEEIDAFNGVQKKAAAPKPAPKPVVEEPAPVVEVKEVEEAPAPKKTTGKKKPFFGRK